MFGSCLLNDHDRGVRGEVERFGLQVGRLAEFLERGGVAVQAGGVLGLRRELVEERVR